MSGWGISELKEMDVEELIFWLRKASKLAERGRRAKEGALAYPEDTSYLAYEYASAYV
jgi:hypothetical protein